jgi:glycosyltransferase involved in cell wall biosynthesis
VKKLPSKLLVLAYNEQRNIEETINDIDNLFDEIIVVDDCSSDETSEILTLLTKVNKKIKIFTNKKNLGPGKSMDIGIKEALKSPFDYLVKVDGDNQFDKEDIKNMLALGKERAADFIKCDRFWDGGVSGDMPKIRYFGNSLASLLIKLLTGNQKINDPLNGLFLFSENICKNINIPKLFNRYGYPFYINAYISALNIGQKYKLFQYHNKINYGLEESKLNPIVVLLKLMYFSFSFFLKTIKKKLRFSSHQLSGLIDIIAIFSLIFSFFSFFMVINTRYLGYSGNQGAWALLFALFFITSFVLLFQSQKILKNINKKDFEYLN